MSSRSELVTYLRDHIVGAMHLGQLHAGDRLPSIREVARQRRGNARTVKAAYGALEREGLVEVRGRSGVYVARQDITGGETLEETARWVGGVVAEGWKRRVPVAALPALIARLTARRIRCGLVEVIEDGIVALQHELETEWGFEVVLLDPRRLAHATDVDFFVVTSFLAASIHAAVEELGKPLVVLTVHPSLKAAVDRQLRRGSLTIVAVDPRFAERMAHAYSPDAPDRVRFVPADDRDALRRLDPREPVLLTRAAHRKIGPSRLPLVFPHSPTVSPESASLLATTLVRLNAGVTSRQP